MSYEWQEGMGEISGMGGGYEENCRIMLQRGMVWFDNHPEANPRFKEFRTITGVIIEANDDAKELRKVLLESLDASGAMYQAVVQTLMWVKANGWEKYVEEMKKGQTGGNQDADENGK